MAVADNPEKPSLDFEYKADADQLIIEGRRYSGDLFRTLALGPVPNTIFRVIKSTQGGEVTVTTYRVHSIAEFERWQKQHWNTWEQNQTKEP